MIQTVGDLSNASCLTTNTPSTSSFFALNPAVPSQCSPQIILWNSTRYQEPPDIRGFIPGGQAFTLDPISSNTTQQSWVVNIRAETQTVLLVQPADPNPNTTWIRDGRMSSLLTVTGESGEGDGCLNNTPSSTVTLVSPTAASTMTGAATADSTTAATENAREMYLGG